MWFLTAGRIVAVRCYLSLPVKTRMRVAGDKYKDETEVGGGGARL